MARSNDAQAGELNANGDFSGQFTLHGNVALDPIQEQLRDLQRTVEQSNRRHRARPRNSGGGDASPDDGEVGVAARDKEAPAVTPLTQLDGAQLGIAKDAMNDIKNMVTRPAFSMYSFEPSKDLHTAQQQARSETASQANGAGTAVAKRRKARDKKDTRKNSAAAFVERMLRADSDVADIGCYEALPQVMWWYAISIGRSSGETSNVLPYLPAASRAKLARLATRRSVVEHRPAYLITALRIAKTAHNKTRAWGVPLARMTNNPGVPCVTDDVRRRHAIHRLTAAVDYVCAGASDEVRERAYGRLRSAALLWEGDAPTLAEQRALLALLYEENNALGPRTMHESSVMRSALQSTVRLNEIAKTFGSGETDDDDDDDGGADVADSDFAQAAWATHNIVYAPYRGGSPARFFGTESCRWYRSSDEHNALSLSDMAPVRVLQPRSVARSVSRTFVGKRDVRQRRVATGRVGVGGHYARHTPSMNNPRFFERLRASARHSIDELVRGARRDMENAAPLSPQVVYGVPPLKPNRFNTTRFLSLPLMKDELAPHYKDVVQDALVGRDAQRRWMCDNGTEFGLQSAAMMGDAAHVPHFRIFDEEMHQRAAWNASDSRDTSYSLTERARARGELCHQVARDVAAMEFYARTRRQVQATVDSNFSARTTARTAAKAHPSTPYTLDHITDTDEATRIAYELYMARALNADFDEQLLAHDVECDAACVVRPKSAADADNARAMLPYPARRTFHSREHDTIEEVRALYWTLVDRLYAHYYRAHALGQKPKKLRLERSGDYRRINWTVRSMPAATINTWLRRWAELERVDCVSRTGVFWRHVYPALTDHHLAPRLSRRNAFNRIAQRAQATRAPAWDGTPFSPTLRDDDYVWLQMRNKDAGPRSITEDIAAHVRLAMTCARKRAEEQSAECLYHRYRVTTRAAPLPAAESVFRKHVAALLLLSVGVYDNRASGTLGRRYYVDTLNELFTRRFSSGAALYDGQPEYGRIARMLSDQFSDDTKQDVRFQLDEAHATRDVVAATVRAFEVDGEAVLTSNTAIRSVIDNVGTVALLTSPHNALLGATTDAGAAEFAKRAVNAILQSTVMRADDFLRAPALHTEAPARSNAVDAALHAGAHAQSASYVGNALNLGDTRNQVTAYATAAHFVDDVDMTLAPELLTRVRREIDFECNDNDARANGARTRIGDVAMWHGYAPFRDRRDRQVKRMRLNANAMKYGAYGTTRWGADRPTDVDDCPTLRINVPSQNEFVRHRPSDRVTHRFEVARLSAYMYTPAMYDPRAAVYPVARTRTYVNAYNQRTLASYTNTRDSAHPATTEERASNSVELDLLRPAKIAYDNDSRVFSHLRDDTKTATTATTHVRVDGRTTVTVATEKQTFASDAASCKPYPLRMPGVNFHVVDTVARDDARYCVRYVLEREALPEHHAAFVNALGAGAYDLRIDGADSIGDDRAYRALSHHLQEYVNSLQRARTLHVPHEHAYDYSPTGNDGVYVMAVHSHVNFVL